LRDWEIYEEFGRGAMPQVAEVAVGAARWGAVRGYPRDAEGVMDQAVRRSELALAKEFLQETLRAGPVQSGKMLDTARELGLSRRTIARAR
jgi:hypothetical protein